jgi:hypothetical protein
MTQKREPNGDINLDMLAYLAHDISKFIAIYTVALPLNENDQKFEQVIVKTSMDLCKIVQGITGDFIAKMLLKNFMKHSDSDLSCPRKKVKIVLVYFTRKYVIFLAGFRSSLKFFD